MESRDFSFSNFQTKIHDGFWSNIHQFPGAHLTQDC